MPQERPWQPEEHKAAFATRRGGTRQEIMMTDKISDLKKTYTDKLRDDEADWANVNDPDDSEADDWDLPEIGDEIDPDEAGQDTKIYGKEPEKRSGMPESKGRPEHSHMLREQEEKARLSPKASEEDSLPLSAFAYFGYALLFCVPVAGVLLLIIIALRTKNRNLRSYAFGFLLFMAAVLAVLCCAVMLGAFDGVLGRA